MRQRERCVCFLTQTCQNIFQCALGSYLLLTLLTERNSFTVTFSNTYRGKRPSYKKLYFVVLATVTIDLRLKVIPIISYIPVLNKAKVLQIKRTSTLSMQ